MYLHEGKLIARNADDELVESRVIVHEDGSHEVIPYGETYLSRPHGATHVTLDEVIRQYHLTDGGAYPAQQIEQNEGQPTPAGVHPKAVPQRK